VDLTVGDADGPHLQINGAAFALATLKAPTPATGTDSRTWTVIEGSINGASPGGTDTCGLATSSLSLVIPGFCLEASQLTLKVNLFSGTATTTGGGHTDAAPLDWGTSLNLDSDAHFGSLTDQLTIGGAYIDLSGALLEATGTARINVFDFIEGT